MFREFLQFASRFILIIIVGVVGIVVIDFLYDSSEVPPETSAQLNSP